MDSATKIHRIWKYIEFGDSWRFADTSSFDDIAPSWYARREVLTSSSSEYQEFIERLKREHAIETGIIERLYDLKKGITETFIKEGFYQSFLSHGDTNVPPQTLMQYLKDHLEAVDFIFDIVKEDRPFTTGFIKELHQLVTRSQDYAEGRDQFGYKTKIKLLRGTFKVRENNPTRDDGTVIYYCPPEHVEAEMDRLIEIYNQLVDNEVHPIIVAAWVHHAFTTIHPFQDGNGRVARLLSSLILIKFKLFPFTVLREEAKVKYIEALETADNGNAQLLVAYFADIQKRNIEKALNLREISGSSLESVTAALKHKVTEHEQRRIKKQELRIAERREEVFEFCQQALTELMHQIQKQLGLLVKLSLDSSAPDDESTQHYFYKQIVGYAIKHDYYFNRTLPRSWVRLKLHFSESKKYQIIISIHHFGYDNSALAIGAFLQYNTSMAIDEEDKDVVLPLGIPPHIMSIYDDFVDNKKKNIKIFLEDVLAVTLAQVASEI